MGNVYIAINGDDVGTRIGNAIANDDHEDLASATQSIDDAHKAIDEWAKMMGGKKITGSGDEAIYLVPQKALSKVDGMRQNYQDASGHGLTVGVGASMSQASKALIYGKMNGKNQTIHYDPNMEDYLSDDQDEQAPQIPAEEELQDQAQQDDEVQEGEVGDEDSEAMPAKAPAPKAAGPDDMDSAPAMDDGSDDEAAAEGDDEIQAAPDDQGDEAPIGNEEDVSDDNEEALNSPDDSAPANKAPKQKHGELDGKTDEDFGTADGEQAADEAEMEDPQDPAADMQDEDTSDEEASDIAQEDDGSAEQTDEDHFDGHHAPPEGAFEGSDDESEDGEQSDDALADMIHGDMQDEDTAAGMPEDEQAAQDDGDHQDLKQDIANALLAFKDNKQMLEQAREQNPDLYNATLTMLRSMIAMAKKLGFAPEQDMQQAEDTRGMQEQMPEASDEGQEQEAAPEQEEAPADEPADDQGEKPEKK